LTTSHAWSVLPRSVNCGLRSKASGVVNSSRTHDQFTSLNGSIGFSSECATNFGSEFESSGTVSAASCHLILFADLKLDGFKVYGFAWSSVLVVHSFIELSSCLNSNKIIIIFLYLLEEILYNLLFYFFKLLIFFSLLLFSGRSLSFATVSRTFCCLSLVLLLIFKILFSSHFSLKDYVHSFLFFWSSLVKRWAQFHYCNCSFSITDSGHVLVDCDGGQRRITNLLTVANFILSIIEIPYIQETINSRQEEKTASCWWPATVCEICWMISSLHYWRFKILLPYLGGPISNRHEIFKMTWVSTESIDWTVMLTGVNTISLWDFNLLPLFTQKNVTLFSTN